MLHKSFAMSHYNFFTTMYILLTVKIMNLLYLIFLVKNTLCHKNDEQVNTLYNCYPQLHINQLFTPTSLSYKND